MSNGKQATVTREMLTAVLRDHWNLSAVFKFCFCFVLLYNKSLNDCSPRDQSLSVNYCSVEYLEHARCMTWHVNLRAQKECAETIGANVLKLHPDFLEEGDILCLQEKQETSIFLSWVRFVA